MYRPINVKEEYRDKLKEYAAKKKKPIIDIVQEWIDSLVEETNKTQQVA